MKLHIYLTPNAKSNSIHTEGEDLYGNTVYKCRIAAPPQNWEANKALIRFLSDQLGVSRTSISILKGHKSRHKIVWIDKADLVIPFA